MDHETIKSTITIIGCIISILSLLGVGTIMTMFWKDKHDKKLKDREEHSDLKEQARRVELSELVSAAINNALDQKLRPLETSIKEIKTDLEKVKKGVQVGNRTDLEQIADKADAQGFCSAYDKQRFEATYQAYHSLGKNGVMDAKRERILAMPETKPVKKTKQRLNENK